MKPIVFLALLLWQVVASTPPGHPNFRYRRAILVTSSPQSGLPTASSPACLILDPAIFPHTAPSLRDLRLFQGDREIPYVITLSEPQQLDPDPATIRNLSLRGRNIVFDLEMPHRPYTDVSLELGGHDFLATASVSGTRNPTYADQSHLGDFTLFDLTGQHLSRSTTLHLQETDLPYLHIELAVSPAPGASLLTPQALLNMVKSVTVPPSREAQSLYTTAAVSARITQRGRQSVAIFTLPERIPIERVSFDLDPAFKSNFSRDVRISDRPSAPDKQPVPPSQPDVLLDTANNPDEILAGIIFRVHLTQSGREIRQQQLSVPATLGSNMQSTATVEVAIDNGDDPPLPVTAIRLEMRQRKLCFNPEAASPPSDSENSSPLILYYGDSTLPAPQYDYARLWSPASTLRLARSGPEQLNPAYRRLPDSRPFTERHPRLLWIALLAVLSILGILAIRSSRTLHG